MNHAGASSSAPGTNAARRVGKALAAPAIYEPHLTYRILPRCSCGCLHPLAHRPPLDLPTCPSCGKAAVAASAPVEVPAVLTGSTPAFLTGRALLRLGRWLTDLSRRL